MLRMNRHVASGATSFLVSGVAPSQNILRTWGHVAMRQGGFGRLAAVPAGYGAPGAGLAMAVTAGEISAFVSVLGSGALTGAGAAGVGVSATLAGAGDLSGTADLVISALGLAAGAGATSGGIVGLFLCAAAAAGVGAAAAGSLLGDGWLAGWSDGESAAIIDPYAHGFMAGTTAVGEVGLSPADIAAVATEAAEQVWRYTR